MGKKRKVTARSLHVKDKNYVDNRKIIKKRMKRDKKMNKQQVRTG